MKSFIQKLISFSICLIITLSIAKNLKAIENVTITSDKFDTQVADDLEAQLIQANNIKTKFSTPFTVNLISFTARKKEGKAHITWNAFETNFHQYELEYSTDVNNWDIAEIIPGQGLNIINAYETILPIPNSAKVYYRLKMVDQDGSIEYSNIRSISGNEFTGYFTAAPNPVSTQMTVNNSLPKSSKYTLEVYDQASKQVIKKELSGELQSIDMSMLTEGIYFVRIYTKEGFNDTFKIIKTK